MSKTLIQDSYIVGADGFEPPKSKDSRFTVCPIWPLWKTPVVSFCAAKVVIYFDKTKSPFLKNNQPDLTHYEKQVV